MENKVKTGVFLTGGGGIGSFHIGALKAMEEHGIKPDFIFGCSAGAIVAGGSTYLSADEMYEKWKEATLESVFKIDSKKVEGLTGRRKNIQLIYECFKSCSKPDPTLMIDVNDLRKLLYRLLDGERIRRSQVDFGISTTELPSFRMENICKKDMDENVNPLEYILASMYLPILTRQKINGKSYVDLCRFRRYPLEILKENGCNRNFFVNVEADNPYKVAGPMNYLYRKDPYKPTFIDYEHKPSILDFTAEQTQLNFQNGYEATSRVLERKAS